VALIYGGIFGKIRGCVGPYKFVIDKRGNNYSVARYRNFTPTPAQLECWRWFSLTVRMASKLYLPWFKPRFVKPSTFYTAIAKFLSVNFGNVYKWKSPQVLHNINGIHEAAYRVHQGAWVSESERSVIWHCGQTGYPPAGSYVYIAHFQDSPFWYQIAPEPIPSETEIAVYTPPPNFDGRTFYTVSFYDFHNPDIAHNWSDLYCEASGNYPPPG